MIYKKCLITHSYIDSPHPITATATQSYFYKHSIHLCNSNNNSTFSNRHIIKQEIALKNGKF